MIKYAAMVKPNLNLKINERLHKLIPANRYLNWSGHHIF